MANEYFQLFLQNAGNVRATLQYIHSHGPYYPDPQVCLPPEGFKTYYRLQSHGQGFCPQRNGLVGLLTNAMYIGHWVHRDAIVRRNNHPAIVPQEVFFAAFNYLSPVTLNGQPNPNYRPFRDVARPTKDSHRPVERPFCAGLIFAEVDGKRRQVGTTWIKSAERYVYVANSGNTEQLNQWVKTAHFVDGTVVRLLRDKLRVTFDAGVWEKIMDQSKAA